jgi:hypothetical protein
MDFFPSSLLSSLNNIRFRPAKAGQYQDFGRKRDILASPEDFSGQRDQRLQSGTYGQPRYTPTLWTFVCVNSGDELVFWNLEQTSV